MCKRLYFSLFIEQTYCHLEGVTLSIVLKIAAVLGF